MKVALLALFALCSSFSNAQTSWAAIDLPEDGWIFKFESEQIKVWYCPDTSRGIYAVRAATSFQCTQETIIELLDDCNSLKTWGYKTTASRLFRRVSDTELYYYVQYDLPWPITDRDAAMHSKRWQNPQNGEVFYHIYAAPEATPEQKSFVRIRNAQSGWRIAPTKNGWTYCEWIVACDPGGSIPAWLVNMAVTRGPLESMKGIRRIIQKN